MKTGNIIMSITINLTYWFVKLSSGNQDQHHRHQLGISEKYKFLGLYSRPAESATCGSTNSPVASNSH